MSKTFKHLLLYGIVGALIFVLIYAVGWQLYNQLGLTTDKGSYNLFLLITLPGTMSGSLLVGWLTKSEPQQIEQEEREEPMRGIDKIFPKQQKPVKPTLEELKIEQTNRKIKQSINQNAQFDEPNSIAILRQEAPDLIEPEVIVPQAPEATKETPVINNGHDKEATGEDLGRALIRNLIKRVNEGSLNAEDVLQVVEIDGLDIKLKSTVGASPLTLPKQEKPPAKTKKPLPPEILEMEKVNLNRTD